MKRKIMGILLASFLLASSASAMEYKVSSGDTLYEISKKFNVTVDEIKQANHLHSDLLQINQVLTIPVDRESKKEPTATAKEEKEESSRSLDMLLGRMKTLATSLVGIPYRYGGTSTKGFDCSGFTQYVMGEMGVNLPRVSGDQFSVGTKVKSDNLRVGDLLFFDTLRTGRISHVGIYIGNNKMIHSATRRVEVSDLNYYFNHYRFYGAKRVLTASK